MAGSSPLVAKLTRRHQVASPDFKASQSLARMLVRTTEGGARMRRTTWLAALTSVVLVVPIVAAPAAQGSITRWNTVATGLDPAVGIAANLNSTMVAVVEQASGHVQVHDAAGSGWTDLGSPGAAPVKQLALSADEVYAVDTANTAFQLDRGAGGWQQVGVDVVDLLASRDGIMVGTNPPRFEPFLYKVDPAGRVSRRDGQGWTLIGSGTSAGLLAERGRRGSTRLYQLNAARTEILEWTGTPGIWTTVGGDAASIAAGLDGVALVDWDGVPKLYTGTPFQWKAMARPVTSPVPFAPNGRLSFGVHTMYYRTAGGHLWGLRWPDLGPLSPRSVVGVPWWHLSAPLVAVAPHVPVGAGIDATVIGHDGSASELTWGSIERSGITFARTEPTQGEDYYDANNEIDDWTGDVGVVPVGGSLPPGIEPSVDEGRRIVLSGRATAAGPFSFVLRVFDSTGATLDIPITLRVLPAGTGPAVWAETTALNGGFELANCLPSRAPMHVWVRDVSAGGAWAEVAVSPVASALDSAGACTGTPSLIATLPPDHLAEVVALDPAAPRCAGHNDPDLLGCVRLRRWSTGDPTAVTPHVNVTG
jgi:hypothetical protein